MLGVMEARGRVNGLDSSFHDAAAAVNRLARQSVTPRLTLMQLPMDWTPVA